MSHQSIPISSRRSCAGRQFERDDFHHINSQWQDYHVVLVNKVQQDETLEALLNDIIEGPARGRAALVERPLQGAEGVNSGTRRFPAGEGCSATRPAIFDREVTQDAIARGYDCDRSDGV
jgi:hypothetical protein